MTIHILSPDVAARIAAGEVVERPASVVKELVENALDAGASQITVELIDGGKRLIRVADNGSGIAADEAPLAFERHATSKLYAVEDLDSIRTLGFRGEALASISAVSRLTMVTRHEDESVGVEIKLDGGAIVHQGGIGAPRGTIVTVENLFFNVPARLKFLKKNVAERRHINALLSRYAMAYPEAQFILRQGGKEVLRTPGSGSLLDALVEIYGAEQAAQMMPIQPAEQPSARDDLPLIDVSGYASQPALNRANRSEITLFVNGRWVQDSSLSYAVVQAYHTMLMTGRYPVAIVMVSLPPEEVDVNVHPAKSEVRFRRPDAAFSAVQRAVRQTLLEQGEARGLTPTMSPGTMWGSPEWAARRERLAQVTHERISQLGLDLTEREDYAASGDDNAGGSPSPRRKRILPMLRIIGQVGATYLVAEGPQGLYLIDQHAAHERILYEQFMRERDGQSIAVQDLLEPIIVELLAEQMALVEENADLLASVGFGLEEFGRNAIRIVSIPALIVGDDPVEGLFAALGDIECGDMPTESTEEEQLIARVCKQAAVKAGQILSSEEMSALIRGLEDCESPLTCPHGRPTLIHLSAEDLAKEFGRLGAR